MDLDISIISTWVQKFKIGYNKVSEIDCLSQFGNIHLAKIVL